MASSSVLNLPPSESRVRVCGLNCHSCGYCKSKKDSSISYGIVSEVMNAEDYQSLMLVGWRRCGTYFYKPIMHRTCCPQYTIRLGVDSYKISKSQRKVLKTVDKYLSTAAPAPTPTPTPDEPQPQILSPPPPPLTQNSTKPTIVAEEQRSDYKQINSDILPVTTAKIDPEANTTICQPQTQKREITIETEIATFTEEKFELYTRYQMSVHKDKPEDISAAAFTRFLVTSPLTDNRPTAEVAASTCPLRYGCYHQLYRLEGKLVAVGVVDLLPSGLSSVYVFYDNDLRQLTLGKYSALKEIEFCKQHRLPYYYMGYYIHSCEKMRYKAEYRPSELLCPTTLRWFPHENCAPILDRFAFSPLEPTLAEQRVALGPPPPPTPPSPSTSPPSPLPASTVPVSSSDGTSSTDNGQMLSEPSSSSGGGGSSSGGSGCSGRGSCTESQETIMDGNCDRSESCIATVAENVGKEQKGEKDDNGNQTEEMGEDASEDEEEDDDAVRAAIEKLGDPRLNVFAPFFALTSHLQPSEQPINSSTGTGTAEAPSDSDSKQLADKQSTRSPQSANLQHRQRQRKQRQLPPEDTVPLDIGRPGMVVYLWQLGPGVRSLAPFLREWVEIVGPQLATRIPVALA